MALVVTNCPSCSKPTRVPDDRGRIRVKCPTCSHSWSYPVVVETAEVAMRCAANGQAFQVHFTRSNPGTLFTIHDITLTETRQAIVPHGMIAAAPQKPTQQTININDLNFAGYHCPSCAILGNNKANPWEFLKCTACNQLVCNASVRRIGNSDNFAFRCVCGCECTLSTTAENASFINEVGGTTRRDTTETTSRLRIAPEPRIMLR